VRTRGHHSARLIRALVPVALLGHAGILAVSLITGLYALALFNIGSCLSYVVASVLVRRGLLRATFTIGLAEVMAHAWFATALLGFASGFHIYVLALIPLAMSFDTLRVPTRVAISVSVILGYLALAVVAHTAFGAADVPFLHLLRYANFSAGAVVLLALSYHYVAAVTETEALLVERNRELEALSRTDQLTQLPNRRHVLESMPQEAQRVRRSGRVACVCVADLDHFKELNDVYGHDAGDRALQYVAALFRSALRAQDMVARWGGEEFLIILPETDLDGAIVAMEKLRRRLCAQPVPVGDTAVRVSVTIGVARFDGDCAIDTVIQRADRALYEGKDTGRDRVVTG